MKKFKWIVEIQVAKAWVEDGFDLRNDNINKRIGELLPYANSFEFNGKVLASPPEKEIAKVQGYKTLKEYRKANKGVRYAKV